MTVLTQTQNLPKMRTIKLKYNGFVFVLNATENTYKDFRPCQVYNVKDTMALLARLREIHPSPHMVFEVVHGRDLTSKHLAFLRARV